jgi:hypothetical protein
MCIYYSRSTQLRYRNPSHCCSLMFVCSFRDLALLRKNLHESLQFEMENIFKASLLLAIAPVVVFNPAFWSYVGIWVCLEKSGWCPKDPKNWKDLPESLKKRMSSIIVAIFPHKTTMDPPKVLEGVDDSITTEKGKRLMFIGNHNLWSIETLLVISQIYIKTGVWPRLCLEGPNEKIPVWSHFLQFLGGFRKEFLKDACEMGLPVLVFPGQMNESLRSRGFKKYMPIWENRTDFVEMSLKNGNN